VPHQISMAEETHSYLSLPTRHRKRSTDQCTILSLPEYGRCC